MYSLHSAIPILISFIREAVNWNIAIKSVDLSYEEIAKRGGGILNSAKILHETSEEELYSQSVKRINEIISLGTGAVEIKSGYGLNLADELKMLRVIKRIKDENPIEVKSTFLGAHTIPREYINDREKYVDIVINEMIPIGCIRGAGRLYRCFLR